MQDVRNKLGAALFCVLLTVVHTWPLASAPGTLSRNDNADAALNAWIIAWVAHQLPRDPLHLYDANIFYPEPRTLAFSEPLIVPALMVAPVLWLGGSAVLAHNLALLAGMALTAFAGYLLALRYTRDAAAGLVAATLVAFNAMTLTSIPHIQMQHGYGVLFALLGFEILLLEPRRWRGAILLGASVLALALTSGYMAVLGLTALVVAAAWRWRELIGARAAGARRRLVLAALATSAVAGLLLAPYWLAHTEQGLARVPATPPAAIAAGFVIAVVALIVVNLEVLRAPRPYQTFEGIPPIYDMLAAAPADAVLVELPFPPARANGPNAAYMVASTRHWRPLLNGYSGFVPASYRRRAESLAAFPGGDTVDELIADGVTHIMIHTRRWNRGPSAIARLQRDRRLVLTREDDEGRYLFAVRR